MFTANDHKQVRQDTPGLGGRVHLDNCGSSLMPSPVIDRMRAYLDQEVALGGYVAQEQHSVELGAVYNALASLFGGVSDDYALTTSAVSAWAKAFYSIPLKRGQNVVTMYNEYCSNYVSCLHRAKRDGIEIRIANADAGGNLDLAHLESLIDHNTKVVSITHVPTSSGQIADVCAIGEIVKKSPHALYLLDACQAVGQLPVNFDDIGCHMATATSRKFLRGPRGVGFLFAKKCARDALDPVTLSNQAAAWSSKSSYELLKTAKMFEDWERSCMLQLGFGAALGYIMKIGPERIYAQTARVAKSLRNAVYSLPNVIPTCSENAEAAIITFNIKNMDAASVKEYLSDNDISVQVSSILHTRLDFESRGLDTTVRVSPHYYNSQDDIDRFLSILSDL